MIVVLLFIAGFVSGVLISFLWGKVAHKTIFAKKDYHSLRGFIAIALMLAGLFFPNKVGISFIGFALGLVIQHSHHKYD